MHVKAMLFAYQHKVFDFRGLYSQQNFKRINLINNLAAAVSKFLFNESVFTKALKTQRNVELQKSCLQSFL